jgi:hypothetical protein
MRDDLEEIRKLEGVIALLKGRSTELLGSIYSVEYLGVLFNISRRFVVADLSPLTFFHLVAHIGASGEAGAIVRLHEQLAPLLICQHQWAILRRQSDRHLLAWAGDTAYRPHICKLCTAYALSGSLPTVGKII